MEENIRHDNTSPADSGTDWGVKERLISYLDFKGLRRSDFVRSIGMSGAYVAAMRRGISPRTIKKIKAVYPDLNTEWLIYGNGNMLLDSYDASAVVPKQTKRQYEVPLLPMAAFAGNLQLWNQGVRPEDCRTIISPIPGAEFALQVKGDSMEPKIHEGSTLLISRINEKAFIPWGTPMVIDTVNGVLVKNLYPALNPNAEDEYDSGYLIAKSINPNYPPMKIPVDTIYGIYRVIGSIEIFTTI